MPTEKTTIQNKGYVTLKMMALLGLENIDVRLLPARMVYQHYLENSYMDIELLML